MRSIGDGERVIATERMDAARHAAGALAHEFANVLGTVRTMTALLQEDLDAESEAASDLAIISSAVDSGEVLLRDLRAFAHSPGLGDGVAELGAVALAVQAEIGATPGRVSAFAVEPHDRLLRVCVAPDRLEALLSGLVRALLEEIPAGSALRIRVLPDPEGAPRGWLAVECQGLERGAGDAARLFEPFVLGKRHRAGLALPAVHAAVALAGGVVSAEIVPGAAVTISLGLPLVPGDAGEPPAASR